MVHHEQSTPANTPTDETIFTHPPHFDPNNPFHRSLSSLDQSLRCDICCNLYQVPVSLYPCLHTFCSLCVRKTFKSQYGSMKRKTECPQCNAVIGNGGNFEKAILPNHHLENLVSLYRNNVRGDLVKSLIRLDVLERKERMMNMKLKEEEEEECNNNYGEEEQKQSMSSAKRARRSTANYKREYSHDNDDEEEDATMTVNHTHDTAAAAAAAASTRTASSLPPPPPPPAAASAASTMQQRKRLPTLSYKHLKRRDLIANLQKHNLPTNGTDAELKHRHEEYILLYNSQCDSQHPMSEQDIIAQVMKEERGRKKERVEEKMSGASQHGVYMKRLGESLAASASSSGGNGGVVVPTTGSKKVDNEMKNTFKDMIQKVKARKEGDETAVGDGLDDVGGGKVPSCIAAAAAVVNGNDGSSSSGGNIASKPRAKSGNASAAASTNTTSAAAAVAVGATTTKGATSKSITNNAPKQKSTTTNTTSTPAKRSRAATTTSKKQATVVSAKKKASGIWKCPACTFENHKYTTAHALCEMCSTARPEKENTSNEVIAIDC